MEYTIRCDVESVNVENLSPEFKTENCVYPRACCPKDQYTGNRLVYETECNTVGWALADLNPCLRGKRGLIQRAVDSWRNSNQDPRLRSRRVRRMAKMNNRKAQNNAAHAPHMAGPNGAAAPPGVPSSGGLPSTGPPSSVRPSLGTPTLGGMSTSQLHHHHAHPASNGTSSGGHDVGGPLDSSQSSHHHQTSAHPPASQAYPPVTDSNAAFKPDLRGSNIFHGLPSYPPSYSSNLSSTPSLTMPPPVSDNFDHFRQPHRSGGGPKARKTPATPADADLDHIFSTVPESKRRKFILVDDPARSSRVRVRVMLENVDVREIPDSYRKANSVYSRSYVPTQFSAETPPPGSPEQHGEGASETRTWVTVPVPDGETSLPIPRRSKARKRREAVLNELGLRMSWSQSRVFSGRGLFLQRALDAYRGKMRSSILAADEGAETVGRKGVPDGASRAAELPEDDLVQGCFETRRGKRMWMEYMERQDERAGKRRRVDAGEEELRR